MGVEIETRSINMAEQTNGTELEMSDGAGDTSLEQTPPSSPQPLSAINEDHLCQICGDKLEVPRVLGCLHVFCSKCLEKMVEHDTPNDALANQDAAKHCSPSGDIICPECKQVTRVDRGIEGLQEDYVLANMIDMVAIEERQIICTSCKAKEKAVARCSDCANFLCPNCVTAHQYMRCFENHKIPVCNECLVTTHKPPEHSHDRISEDDKENDHVKELASLVNESKTKMNLCNEATSSLDGSLRDLQMQRDNARGLIQETFQSYKAVLEKRQNDLLEELEKIHSDKELHIMEIFHNIEKVIEKIDDGCSFAQRILEHGNCSEILSMKKLIASQLLSLINNTPKPDVNINIEFLTDSEKFEHAVKEWFGTFKKEEVKESPSVSPHNSFENEGITLPAGLLGDEAILPSVTAADYLPPLPSLTPLTLPNMATTAAAAISSIAAGIAGISAQTMQSIASSIQNLPNVERSSSRNSYSPAMSDSGISVDAVSNSSGNNQTGISLSSLAKLGTVSVNDRGQITLNGQVIQGLNINNVTGLPPPVIASNRVVTPTTPVPEHSLANILSTISSLTPAAGTSSHTPPSVPTPTTRAQTPQLNELASILSQTSPTLSSLGSIVGTAANATLLSNGLDIKTEIGTSSVLPTGTPIGIPPPTTPTFGHPVVSNPGIGVFGVGQPPFPARSTNKMSAMQIRCKFGQLGPGKGQFNSPHGFCLGMDEDIVVADTNNHRVQVFEKTGEFKYQFGIPGREEGQLWYPRKVAVIRHSGKYVVCDRGNERSRMQIFTKNGHFIKKIAIRYIDIVAGLAVTAQGHIVAVDSVSPTVFVIAETGDLIKWFDCSDYMREPSDIAINNKEYFVCDFKGHCVVVFNDDGQFVRRIGCENITNYPNGIDISDAGDVLVGDSHGNRFHVAVFQRDGSLIGEFECPYVKVSRCCGLKITSEGYIVTLAKNNHHVLVLNTLYIS
ncbi:hypothetical protein LSH36_2g03012 [Paralvinella palmiformis]|uniref:Uncharacterized protein n=1 Tax=Paralvinella palmiformis TaxID=53620 RepID=A0AAD9KF56_9ANNE|nr:hypothetical protein LSH36_2g03012 [Paralvinella palmiformis]